MTRNPARTFANPYIICTTCGVQVRWYESETGNDPCGHSEFNSACPSWSPVDGCKCSDQLGRVPHGPAA